LHLNEGRVVFVSDAHFGSGAGEPERRASFVRFLDAQHGCERLVIAGDLFQFWFDLGRTIPQGYFDILDAVYRLRRSGTQVDYLAGNHDYWRGAFFTRELQVDVHAGPLEFEAQGRRVHVAHGDGQGPGDAGYKFLRAVVRSPLVIGAARAVHPDLLHAFAHAAGRWSRVHTDQRPPDHARLEAVAQAAWDRGYDAVVLGHVHVQLQLQHQTPHRELIVIGDWLDLRSYVTLESGIFTPSRWPATP